MGASDVLAMSGLEVNEMRGVEHDAGSRSAGILDGFKEIRFIKLSSGELLGKPLSLASCLHASLGFEFRISFNFFSMLHYSAVP